MARQRLDRVLVERGLSEDLDQARALILSGRVLVDEQRIDKPGTPIGGSPSIRVKSSARKYVSRGGMKLEGALLHFGPPVKGQTCLDLGASTGGFTDCLLQHGALRVHAFDVGTGQLHWDLRRDPRVRVCEQVNVRYLTPSMVGEPISLITVDLAFISLRLIFPRLRLFPSTHVIALIKPQFEARRQEVEKGGLVKDPRLRQEIIDRVKGAALADGLTLLGEMPSPLPGQKGNLEHFVFLKTEGPQATSTS